MCRPRLQDSSSPIVVDLPGTFFVIFNKHSHTKSRTSLYFWLKIPRYSESVTLDLSGAFYRPTHK